MLTSVADEVAFSALARIAIATMEAVLDGSPRSNIAAALLIGGVGTAWIVEGCGWVELEDGTRFFKLLFVNRDWRHPGNVVRITTWLASGDVDWEPVD